MIWWTSIEGEFSEASIHEVDLVTHEPIIEVTTRRAGKSKQIRKLLANPEMNPAQKPVILFAPHYGAGATTTVTGTGAGFLTPRKNSLRSLRRSIGEKWMPKPFAFCQW